jgi:hypothetical protein
MRRSIGLVLAALLALLLLAAPGAASASEAATGPVVLAVDEPLGPEPMPRDAEDNPARELAGYEDKETQFTWGAAWLLLFLGVVGLVVMVGVYHFLVDKPSREPAGRS